MIIQMIPKLEAFWLIETKVLVKKVVADLAVSSQFLD